MPKEWNPLANPEQVPRADEANSRETCERKIRELLRDLDDALGQAMMAGPAETAGIRFSELATMQRENLRIVNDTEPWDAKKIEAHQKGLDTLARKHNIDPSVTDGLIAKLRKLADDFDKALNDPSI